MSTTNETLDSQQTRNPDEQIARRLEALRVDIDRIDDGIHALLMERAAVVQKVASVKAGNGSGTAADGNGGADGAAPSANAPAHDTQRGADPDADTGSYAVFRPAREAMILRRLTARHRGPFPLPALLRIWRELISGSTRIQGPFAVAACVAEGDHLIWDIARDHFGSNTPIRVMRTPMPCVRAVMDREASIGVVPWPEDNDPSPWWTSLLSRDPKTPTIVTRLPFACSERNGGSGGARALAIARAPHEPTGDDRSFIGLELSEGVSRSRLKDAIERAGLTPTAFWSAAEMSDRSLPTHLIEVDSYLSDRDPALTQIERALDNRVQRIGVLGGYAKPIDLDQVEDRSTGSTPS